ncbi:Excinuclease ABC subunit C [Clostridiaceae bacterium JG1575]|nr:Excinuclease ABC subunit C [Clostridiaceae bacterium JG1575]
MFDFDHQLSLLPKSPGVYLMKNASGDIIYIGKAKVLRNRVRQYFQSPQRLDRKTQLMVSHVAEFDYIVTDTEVESLILEQNLIKENLPKYNINLKDDKRYPFIKITMKEDFPRVFMTRRLEKDGSRYFGPYTDVDSLAETLEYLKKNYPIRTCKRIIIAGGEPQRPCLNYHMGLCKAPCAGLISQEAYGGMIEEILQVLSGHEVRLNRTLKKQMEEAAQALRFEEAAALRDQLLALESVQRKQKIHFAQKDSDEDYIALAKDAEDTCIQVFFLREGKIKGREHFILKQTLDQAPEELLGEFLKSFYGKTAYIPSRIYVQETQDLALIASFLSLKKDAPVHLDLPLRGDKKRLLDLVEKNAQVTLSAFKGKILREAQLGEEALEQLAELLGLPQAPTRIESYDISNIAGVDSVGSLVVFENGKEKPSDYRRFRIKSVRGPDDVASLKEIMTRRFARGQQEIEALKTQDLAVDASKFSFFPDLILMDGGKGQIHAAQQVLQAFHLDIPVAGLVKDDRHRTRGILYEGREVPLKKNPNVLQFLTKIQDEVHRFAITYHRSLRKRTQIRSVLEDVPGIGPRRRKNLLLHFGSVAAIQEATAEALLKVPAMDKRSVASLMDFFHPKEGGPSEASTGPEQGNAKGSQGFG